MPVDVRGGHQVPLKLELAAMWYWNLNPGHLQEQPVLITSELSLQAQQKDVLMGDNKSFSMCPSLICLTEALLHAVSYVNTFIPLQYCPGRVFDWFLTFPIWTPASLSRLTAPQLVCGCGP